ncbi:MULTISPECIES: 4'-phosphopantetheinyl transferase family protein [unclassified Streptomyces]|uniref:4'-phosphopantetheinyl transferase family protein n=1 Tax=unclassified Streptomyces TaxID=2593676 RepID=UPI0025536D53|nr:MULTISPECIES: 4'-phosphopantetheinyl transferase superfamily protein [unclassified Streptomyces]WRZ66404.1 4'-phosphopantetheinyl transferase superfamily protein [Streptomyces sp. NBC_01257]WSU60398.1 4'-phosphopantetheinyl transferase superfamily protein [Streptomyces sp. NBC_01104]
MTAPGKQSPGRTFGEPILISGPDGDWDRVRADLAEHACAVLYARLEDWRPERAGGPRLRALLGRDWARYLDLTHPDVRTRFASSRVLLKFAAAAALRVPPQAVELGYTPSGRPYLRGYDGVQISLSHTENLLLVGLATGAVIGVDAERSDRVLYGPGLGRHLCTPHEIELVEAMDPSERDAALIRLWTLKEAYSKAIGLGMQFRFTDFGFETDGTPTEVRRPDGTPGTGNEWAFRTFYLDGEYTISVAAGDSGFGGTGDTQAHTTLDGMIVDVLTEALGEDVAETPTDNEWW